MIDGRQLLADLQPVRKQLEDDLRVRSDDVPELGQRLKDEWQAARERERTAQAYEAWREDVLAQAAVMWLVACVFVRFLEDNALVEPPRLAGPGARLSLARDQRTLYFQAHPHASDRDYLYSVFEAVAKLPAASPLFDHRHNPIWNLGISGDAATQVVDFWQRVDPDTGTLVYDFTDPDWQTRFLGDLYQDLSESARKKYALLQTPDFVLQFILDRTLTPAIAEFGFRDVCLIDPACGSGHFLLGAFDRLFRLWSQHEPGTNPRQLAQRALAQVAGVDLNPFAVAIARFRLLLAAIRASNITRLIDAPAFEMELAAGDSLLHGPRPGDQGHRQMHLDPSADPLAHVYATEDAEDLKRILGRRYHVVVGNPPYITAKDAALSQAYRERFGSCHRQYSLGVPFTERFFDLALEPEPGEVSPSGHVGMITANSFMKRQFGKKLIEEFIPIWDVTNVIDTSGAYIPGHTTPTVILLGRHRAPTSSHVRAVLGIKGEPTTPADPSQGRVWRAIVDLVDRPGSSSDFISVSDTDRATFHKHPWSIGGGGAAELKASLDERSLRVLGDVVGEIGFSVVTREDDVFLIGADTAARWRIPSAHVMRLVSGEDIRDWSVIEPVPAIWPYDPATLAGVDIEPISRFLWPWKAQLSSRVAYGQSQLERGLKWSEYSMFFRERFRVSLSIAFARIATHNHFVLDRGGKVFKESAPVVKLPAGATDTDHLGLLGLLNSSTACFWMKQVFYPKATAAGDISVVKGKREANRYEFAVLGLHEFPLPDLDSAVWQAIIATATRLQALAEALHNTEGQALLSQWKGSGVPFRSLWEEARARYTVGRDQMIWLQEELDWQVYALYGLASETAISVQLPSDLPRLQPEQRVYERREATNALDRERLAVLDGSADLRLIETREFKRQWLGRQGVYGHLSATYDERVAKALSEWLLTSIERDAWTRDSKLVSVAALADRVRLDPDFLELAANCRGEDTFDVSALVLELVESAAVPFLPVLRYKESGLRKREQWERTWNLQRRKDAGENVGEIPVPPRYASADFRDGVFWHLRGKLDVPKERFISFPFCQRDADPTLLIGWAGWDHLQQAKALATYYVQMKESEGWSRERLTPLLAGVLELLPWLVQWHNDIDPEFGQRMCDYFDGFVDEEARALGLTREAISAWAPPTGIAGRRGRRTLRTDE